MVRSGRSLLYDYLTNGSTTVFLLSISCPHAFRDLVVGLYLPSPAQPFMAVTSIIG